MDNETDSVFLRTFEVNNYPVMVLYVIVFLWAVVANILVIVIVIKYRYMGKATNYFLVNLSVADLLVALICMPNAIYLSYTKIYYFGRFMCKASGYLQCIAVASSIFTITAMAIDRYIAISKPFGLMPRSLNRTTTIVVIKLLWTFSILLFYPQYDMIEYTEVELINTTLHMCMESTQEWYIPKDVLGIIWFIFMFVVPGVIMIFAYSMMGRTLCSVTPPFDNNEGMSSSQQRNRLVRARKRVAIILLLLAFVFAICWLPYHIVILLKDLKYLGDDRESKKYLSNLQPYLLLLGHTNSALNPVIYCVLSRRFRDSIKDLFLVRLRFTRRRSLMQVDSSASATQLHYLHRLKSIPSVNNHVHFGISRLPSSQKTTKTTRTCAV